MTAPVSPADTASPSHQASRPFRLRAHRPGDIGWAISAQGAGYARQFGWSIAFEALVARIAADFLDRFDPADEACWIAEQATDGPEAPLRLGCVFVVRARDEATREVQPGTAQLRMLWVEPAGRGQGVAQALVDEVTAFARQRGYRRLVLWTQQSLGPARRLYERAGYRRVAEEAHHSFGVDLIGEQWVLDL
jgi:ribosomal protein S18 acetylase RimI-like enzyme